MKILVLIAALSITQAEEAYPRTYASAIQCSALAAVTSVAHGEAAQGPRRSQAVRLLDLAFSLTPAGRSQAAVEADLAEAQIRILERTGRPSAPDFAYRVDEMRGELAKCESLLRPGHSH